MKRALPSPKGLPAGWLLASLVAAIFAGLTFVVAPAGRPRSVLLGALALVLLMASGAYAARKRFFLSKLGTLYSWALGHLALGSLLVLVVLLHGGLARPSYQGWLLYALLAANVASGLWGVYEQRATPRRFARFEGEAFSFSTSLRRRLAILQEDLETTLARRRPELRDWFEQRCRPALDGRTGEVDPCEGYGPRDERHARDLHDRAREIVRLRGNLRRLEPAVRRSERWSFVHVPLSVALVVVVTVHLLGWLYYG